MSPPLVSVIITTKNRCQLLLEAVESVRQIHAEGFDVEILVIDDGSTDDTVERLADLPVRCISTGGVGMAAARNRGIEAASGQFISLLDDDDLFLPAAIGSQMQVFAENPGYGIVFGQAQHADMDGVAYGDPFPDGARESGWIFEDLLTYFPQIGTAVTRTSVAREVGGFDGSLTGDNDWDWFLRIAKRHQVGRIAVPVILFRHRGEAHESLAWRRFPAMITIFKNRTGSLPPIQQIRLRPILWRHRGWWASNFLMHAEINRSHGERARARQSVIYAFRVSPPHAMLGFLRGLLRRRGSGS